jgi:hypothetical protein
MVNESGSATTVEASGQSAIGFAAMSDAFDRHNMDSVFYGVDHPVITNSNSKCVGAADKLAAAIRPPIACQLLN